MIGGRCCARRDDSVCKGGVRAYLKVWAGHEALPACMGPDGPRMSHCYEGGHLAGPACFVCCPWVALARLCLTWAAALAGWCSGW